MLGTGCIVRNLPIWEEIGLKDRENSFILNFDMSEIPVEEIYKGLKEFKYTPPKSDWGKYLDDNGKYDPNKLVSVKCKKSYTDLEKNDFVTKDTEYEVTEKRKNYLTDLNLVDII